MDSSAEQPGEQPDEELEALLRVLGSHAIQIMEHCDSVQIIVTTNGTAQEESATVSAGKGNYFARIGSVRHWLLRCEREIYES